MKRKFKLAIPIFHNETRYTEIEVDEPTSGALANMTREGEKGNVYSALFTLLKDCTETIFDDQGNEVSDKKDTVSILRHIPYRSMDQAIVNILLANGQDSGTEGMYSCPRCDYKIVTEIVTDKETGEVLDDTLDYLDTLPIVYLPEDEELQFSVDLSDTIDIPGHGLVATLTFRYPTANDCINAFKKKGGNDAAQLQYAIFKEALLYIDEFPADIKWKNRFGDYLFTHFKSAKKDLNSISAIDNKYGIDYNIQRVCPECGKEFTAPVDTSNFFASALPSS